MDVMIMILLAIVLSPVLIILLVFLIALVTMIISIPYIAYHYMMADYHFKKCMNGEEGYEKAIYHSNKLDIENKFSLNIDKQNKKKG